MKVYKYLLSKLIVALDIPEFKKIKEVIDSLDEYVDKFKIGPIGYIKCGPKVVDYLIKKNKKVFLDFKLYDIPNTMLESIKLMADLNIWACTVHLKAGERVLKSVVESINAYTQESNKNSPLILGVSELTSKKVSINKVLNLCKIAYNSGIKGVVCSVWEAKAVKERFGLLVVSPGIRNNSARDDQKRIATVKNVIEEGVDYFVVGRPILKSKNYLEALWDLLKIK